MDDRFNIPILFIVFNRPELTRQVFGEIKKIKPAKLFIAADGPRTAISDDIKKCRETREIIKEVDWPCDLKTLFQEKNLGCKIGEATAIDWFFSNVPEGIILEDDTLPNSSFFHFCGELLGRYRDDEKIMAICGTNLAGSWDTPYSYIFSKYFHSWGWAGWRRAWTKYDVNMKSWADPKNQEIIKRNINNKAHWKVKKWLFDRTFRGKRDTWDYQWEYALLLDGGVSIFPKNNQIQNIGFGKDATHTSGEVEFSLPTSPLVFPLKHSPVETPRDLYYDFCFNKMYQPKTFFRRASEKMGQIFLKRK